MSEFKNQAPEQEAVEALLLEDCVEHRHPGYGGGYFGTDVVMVYRYPSAEIERLRAENNRLLSAGQALEADFSSYRREVERKAEAFLSATAQPAEVDSNEQQY